MTKAIERRNVSVMPEPIATDLLNKLVTSGDLKGLTPDQQRAYYIYRCQLLDLDPATQPFDLINLQGKLTLYAKKECASQLSSKRGLSATIVTQGIQGDLYVVQARCKGGDGRETDDLGAVSIKGKAGDDLCNAMMKAATKAKRRAILSHCGLGMLDESELETVRGGWNGSGSKEQAQAVAEAKLAQFNEQAQADLAAIDAEVGETPKEAPPPSHIASSEAVGPSHAVVVPKISRKRMDQFQEAKACFIKHKGHEEGQAIYYRFLKPYPKSNHVPDDATAKRILLEMGKMKKALELEAAERESNDASLYCHRSGVGCPVHIANSIAACIKKLETPFQEANDAMQTTLQDRRREYPDSPDADHWNVILLGLQDVLGKKERAK